VHLGRKTKDVFSGIVCSFEHLPAVCNDKHFLFSTFSSTKKPQLFQKGNMLLNVRTVAGTAKIEERHGIIFFVIPLLTLSLKEVGQIGHTAQFLKRPLL
jgi:hypothetical protein